MYVGGVYEQYISDEGLPTETFFCHEEGAGAAMQQPRGVR